MFKPYLVTGVAVLAALMGAGCKDGLTGTAKSTADTKILTRSDPRPVTPPPSLPPTDSILTQTRATPAPAAPDPDAPSGDEPECEAPDCGDVSEEAEVGS